MHITKKYSTIIHKAAEMISKPTSISGKEKPETKGMFSTMNSFCALYSTDIYRIFFSPKNRVFMKPKVLCSKGYRDGSTTDFLFWHRQ